MPRNGKFVRITLAARCGRGSSQPSRWLPPARRPARARAAPRSPAPAARSSRRSSRSGSARSGRRSATSSTTARSAPAAASPRSPTAPSTSARATRRSRPTSSAHARAASRSRGRSRRPSVIYNLPGVKNLLHMDGPTLAKIYHRQDHELERPGDQEAQPGRQPARHEDHGRPPLRQLGHDLQLHRLPLDASARRGSRRSARASRSTGRPARAAAAARASPAPSHRPPAAIGYVDVALRAQEPPAVLRDEEPVRQVRRRRA